MIYIYEISYFRFWLYIAFYAAVLFAIGGGIMSAWNAPDAMAVCQANGHSFATCFEGLNR